MGEAQLLGELEVLKFAVALLHLLEKSLAEAQPEVEGLAEAQWLALLQPLLLCVEEVQPLPEAERETEPVPLRVPLVDTHPLRDTVAEPGAEAQPEAVTRTGEGVAQALGKLLALELPEKLTQGEDEAVPETQPEVEALGVLLCVELPLPLLKPLWL